jgi:hypothetical protein
MSEEEREMMLLIVLQLKLQTMGNQLQKVSLGRHQKRAINSSVNGYYIQKVLTHISLNFIEVLLSGCINISFDYALKLMRVH